MYPAVLGLLSEYNDNWSDLSEYNDMSAMETFRTVPWISQGMIKRSRLSDGSTDFIIRRSILNIEEDESSRRLLTDR